MYAFISNEFRTIVYTQSKLELLRSLYSYPQFKKCDTYEEAIEFLNKTQRKFIYNGINKYNKNSNIGYVSVQYFIADNKIYVNIDTSKLGYIKLTNLGVNVKQEASYDMIRLVFNNVVLDNSLIQDHCIAITSILRLFDNFVNVELKLPDISILLACTKYTGNMFQIRTLQNIINGWLGHIYYTI